MSTTSTASKQDNLTKLKFHIDLKMQEIDKYIRQNLVVGSGSSDALLDCLYCNFSVLLSKVSLEHVKDECVGDVASLTLAEIEEYRNRPSDC